MNRNKRDLIIVAAWAAGMVLALCVGCLKPRVEYVHAPCPPIQVLPRPQLPVQNYHPTWTREQLLSANVQSVALLLGWAVAQQELVKAHNEKTQTPPEKR